MKRRTFLIGAAHAGVIGAAGLGAVHLNRVSPVKADVRYPGMREGHALRDATAMPAPRGELRTGVVILGSGVAGMACAWAMARAGRRDFVLLEGPEYGGNASSANPGGAGDDVLACPLGAHYLPLPSTERAHVRALLADVGVLLRGEHTRAPYYDEAALSHSPKERWLRDGRWESDALPTKGLGVDALQQQQRFFAQVDALRVRRGRDGRRLFAIPVALSSTDAEWRALDRETFAHWLDRHGYTAPGLRWYLDYCCRDDYGASTHTVSAWAGLHYFASRDGKASNASDEAVLTWPGGLSELIARMRAATTRRLGHERWLRPGFAARIADHANGVDVVSAYHEGATLAAETIRADHAVSAMPLHVLARIWPGMRDSGYDPATHASPHAAWLVSNFLVDGYPTELPGETLAWDNVVHGGRGLGYVVSTHQLLRVAPAARSVFTAYQSLDRISPQQARTWLMRASAEELRAEAASDLSSAYGDQLWRRTKQLSITVRGHAMAIPTPGYLDNAGLAALRGLDGRVRIAHADLSGYSIFEEAAWWGVRAAEGLA
ncbi:Membrane protein [Lysobacter dokdonensis DS-58]|uniref:Membrane protein n=1 Tax=Lysobacter dokdonensis DS-58 TaxID=1300345 RepID=A0A0A2WJ73_9GAMM|nr:NAD(P)/FAD-dependent oxidoreductase [Lysobacter dokdonensis]KGQ18762.1 Membrane protein [Lysobacter dokdonensis DS-58]